MYTIYSKLDCIFCERAKQKLVEENYEHKIKVLGVHFEVEDLYEIAPRTHKTFPVITKDGEYVGGYHELLIDIEKGVTDL